MPKVIEAARRVGLPYPMEARPGPQLILPAIELTSDDEPRVRQAALSVLCACRVRSDDERIWDRVFALASDPDPRVRQQVLHTLTDGSPRRLTDRAASCIARLSRDPAPKVRKQARAALARYERTGRINTPDAH